MNKLMICQLLRDVHRPQDLAKLMDDAAEALSDTMRENDMLRARIAEMTDHEFNAAGYMIEKPNKDTDNGN